MNLTFRQIIFRVGVKYIDLIVLAVCSIKV